MSVAVVGASMRCLSGLFAGEFPDDALGCLVRLAARCSEPTPAGIYTALTEGVGEGDVGCAQIAPLVWHALCVRHPGTAVGWQDPLDDAAAVAEVTGAWPQLTAGEKGLFAARFGSETSDLTWAVREFAAARGVGSASLSQLAATLGCETNQVTHAAVRLAIRTRAGR